MMKRITASQHLLILLVTVALVDVVTITTIPLILRVVFQGIMACLATGAAGASQDTIGQMGGAFKAFSAPLLHAPLLHHRPLEGIALSSSELQCRNS